MRPKVGLILSGGGARGLAHIGVIKVLESKNIPIDIITGTSAGALFGGIYASGTSIDDLEKVCFSTGYRQIVGLILDLDKNSGGLIKGKKITDLISSHISKKKIENFPIKFGCVAANLLTGEKIFFTKGDALRAIRASISYPGVFSPVKYKNMYLIDGGVVEPIPIEFAKKLGADVIVGVDVTTDIKINDKIKKGKFSLIDSLRTSVSIMQNELVERSFEKNHAIKIKPELGNMSIFNFGSSRLMINAIKEGERATKEKMSEIREVIENYQKK